MFRSPTAPKPALSRRGSFVEGAEQIRIEKAVLGELRKGLYSIKEANLATDESDRNAARSDASAAYEKVRGLLSSSPLPINETAIREMLRQLETAIASNLS